MRTFLARSDKVGHIRHGGIKTTGNAKKGLYSAISIVRMDIGLNPLRNISPTVVFHPQRKRGIPYLYL